MVKIGLILIKYCIAMIFVLFSHFVFSQTDEYFKKMDSIFDISSKKVTTGILINRAPGLIDMQTFYLQKNAKSAKVCNREDWLLLYYTLYAAHLNPKGFRYNLNLYKEYRAENVKIGGAVPLGLIYYRYDKIRDEAIMRKLIDVDTINQQVIDLSGNGTPLETANCLAFTVFTDSVEAGRNEFVLPQSLFVSNQQHNINAIYVDFGDGQGFIQVVPDIPVTVYYDKTGNTTITMRAVIDSQNYYTTTEIKIIQKSKAAMIIDKVPCGGYEKFPLYFSQKFIFLCMIENFMLSLQKI